MQYGHVVLEKTTTQLCEIMSCVLKRKLKVSELQANALRTLLNSQESNTEVKSLLLSVANTEKSADTSEGRLDLHLAPN